MQDVARPVANETSAEIAAIRGVAISSAFNGPESAEILRFAMAASIRHHRFERTTGIGSAIFAWERLGSTQACHAAASPQAVIFPCRS